MLEENKKLHDLTLSGNLQLSYSILHQKIKLHCSNGWSGNITQYVVDLKCQTKLLVNHYSSDLT